MGIQNGTMMSKEENGQSLLKQSVPETLSGMQELPEMSVVTYEMMEASETKEAAVFRDMGENLDLWKTLTNKEALKRIRMIHHQVEEEMEAQNKAY